MAETDQTPPAPHPTRVAKPKRGSETAMDMVRSLGLIAVIVAVTLVFVPALLHPGKKDKIQPITYSNYLEGFRSTTGAAALAPTPVPTGWHANSAALTGPTATEHLRIGFVTPDNNYVALLESVAPSDTAIRSLLGKGSSAVTGHVQINGESWAMRTSAQHEAALSHTVSVAGSGNATAPAEITIMVTGSASAAQLQALATSLH